MKTELALRATLLVLMSVGVVELGLIFGRLLAGGDLSDVVGHLGPGALLPVTLAVLFASTPGMSMPPAIALGAGVFALMRIVASVWLVMIGDISLAGVLTLVMGCAVGLMVAVWAIATRMRQARDPGTTAASRAQPAPAALPEESDGGTIRQPRPGQAEPRPEPQSQWRFEASPWPRKDEADPNGTLLRPPRRR